MRSLGLPGTWGQEQLRAWSLLQNAQGAKGDTGLRQGQRWGAGAGWREWLGESDPLRLHGF